MEQLSLPFNLPNTQSKTVRWFREMLAVLNVNYQPAWPDQFGLSLRQWLLNQNYSPIKTLSLFSGGGGLDIAFHDAGFDILQMVEIEAKYIKTLEKNSLAGKRLENAKSVCIDIKNFIPDPSLEVDFIIGGPPCQTFSAASRRAAGVSGTNDPRGILFQEYVRLLKILQPKGFLFENVYGVTGANQGQAWQLIQTAFQEAGYYIYFRVLDAADYGVPQHRERLFIVGIKKGQYLFPYPTHGPDSLDKEPFYSASLAVKNADIADIELEIGGKYGYLLKNIPPGLNYSFYTEKMGHPNPVFSWRAKFSDFLYKADPDTPVRTIKAQGGQYTGPFSWENRRFSLGELKRLQTIPDDYELVGNKQICLEQIGNSVPPQLGRILALSILDQVMGIQLPFPMSYMQSTKQLGFRQRKRQLTQIYLQKAKAAITKLKIETTSELKSIAIYCYQDKIKRFISQDFAWLIEATNSSLPIHIDYDINHESWFIVGYLDLKNKNQENQYIIDINPRVEDSEWLLNTREVKLCAKELNQFLFTALWKAFEEKLNDITGKADIVQLSGYYQYKPQISCVLNFNPNLQINLFWLVVQCVVRGIGVANQLTAKELANLWEIDAKNILNYLQELRQIGYEVRNTNTNPQIPKGKYLIPYAFPTLTPKSVQLRKTLN